jgi:hypothetical protein
MANKEKTNRTISAAGDRSANSLTGGSANVTEDDIARRAHELYMASGRAHGRDLEDWLQAERELRAGVRSTAA